MKVSYDVCINNLSSSTSTPIKENVKDSEVSFKDLIKKNKKNDSDSKEIKVGNSETEINSGEKNDNKQDETKNIFALNSLFILKENDMSNLKNIDIKEFKNQINLNYVENTNLDVNNNFVKTNEVIDTTLKIIGEKDISIVPKGENIFSEEIKSQEHTKIKQVDHGNLSKSKIISDNVTEVKEINEKDTNVNKNSSIFTGEMEVKQVSDNVDKLLNNIKSNLLSTKDEMITIKVADPTDNKSWIPAIKELGDIVSNNIKNDKIQQFKISLNPKDLGKIDVDFIIKDNKISVSFSCSNESTRKIISENSGMLSKLIESNLGQDTTVNVYSDKTLSQQNSRENFDGRGNNRYYRDESKKDENQDDHEDSDFIQKLRLGILQIENMEV